MLPPIEMNTDHEASSRMRLYDFTKGKQTFHQWQAGLMPDLKGKAVLELGAGNGDFWHDLLPTSQGAKVVLSDINESFLNTAQSKLEPFIDQLNSLSFKVMDFNKLDLGDSQFDVVIANHNLFYAEDLDSLLVTLAKHISAGGALVCSTVGRSHLHELISMMRGINPSLPWSSERWAEQFGLENGYKKLHKFFPRVDQFEYDNNLHLSSLEPIFSFVHKTMKGALSDWATEHQAELEMVLQHALSEKGYIRLTPQSGFFVAYTG